MINKKKELEVAVIDILPNYSVYIKFNTFNDSVINELLEAEFEEDERFKNKRITVIYYPFIKKEYIGNEPVYEDYLKIEHIIINKDEVYNSENYVYNSELETYIDMED